MSDLISDQERIDTLLALALASMNEPRGSRRASGDEQDLQRDAAKIESESDGQKGEQNDAAQTDDLADDAPRNPLECFAALREADQRLLRRRHDEWYAKLSADRQSRWLKFTLGRVLNDPRRHVHARRLDEHVHPSQIVEVLRREPPPIRKLVLAHLPASLAVTVRRDLAEDAVRNQATARRVAPECVDVVRGAFLDHFVHLEELPHTTALDLLSGAELARLVRLLGTRETAVACRGIAAVEAVAAFLRRFAPEDARAIAAHMATLTDLTTERVRFAETNVQAGLHDSSGLGDMNRMLDAAGLHILSLSLLERHASARSYMWQKFPVAAADLLRQALEANRLARRARGDFREMIAHIVKDTESFAAHLKRRPRQQKTETRDW